MAFKAATIYAGIGLPSFKIKAFITDVNYTLKIATLYNTLYGVCYNGSQLTTTLNFVAARILAVRARYCYRRTMWWLKTPSYMKITATTYMFFFVVWTGNVLVG